MHVLALRADLHIPDAQSLKAKRSVVLSLVRTLDGWTSVAAAEVGAQDKWQRSVLGISIVGAEPGHIEEVADRVERHVWAAPGAEVLEIERSWMEHDGWEPV